MTASTPIDPMDSAMEPQAQPRAYFGKLTTKAAYIALVKGQGRMPFQEGVHKEFQRKTLVTLALKTFGSMQNPSFDLIRDLIANPAEQADPGWLDVTLPSLQKLRKTLKEINGMCAQIELRDTGETYEKEQFDERGKSTGFKTVHKTAPYIVALFPTEDSARAAENLYYGDSDSAPAPSQANGATVTSPIGGSPFKEQNGNTNGARQAALLMLPTLWTAFNKDRAKFLAFIAGDASVSAHFNADSPEVLNVMENKPATAMRTEPLPTPAQSAPKARRNVPQTVDSDEDLPF